MPPSQSQFQKGASVHTQQKQVTFVSPTHLTLDCLELQKIMSPLYRLNMSHQEWKKIHSNSMHLETVAQYDDKTFFIERNCVFDHYIFMSIQSSRWQILDTLKDQKSNSIKRQVIFCFDAMNVLLFCNLLRSLSLLLLHYQFDTLLTQDSHYGNYERLTWAATRFAVWRLRVSNGQQYDLPI